MGITPGTRLGPYEIISLLGRGGMGEVFRARDPRLDREVAIKVLPEDFSKDADALRRFQREAKALAALSHPGIVSIFDVGTEQDVNYVVMELLEGENLRTRIARASLSPKTILHIAGSVAEALAAAHAKGLIHRDLKPENIFLTVDDRVKILDFGLARRTQRPPRENAAFLPTVSATIESESVSGTVPYMSPEQLRGGTLDARTDIFAFGCVLYEMLARKRPFSGTTSTQVIAAILTEEPAPLSSLTPEISPNIERVVYRCLQKNPDARFQSASDLGFALKETAWPSTTLQLESKPDTRRSYIRYVLPIAILLIITASSFLILKKAYSHPEIRSIAVLPFMDESKESSTEYLSDGITDSLINSLSEVKGLRVMARTSVFAYKNKNVSPQQVAQDLKVGSVLVGKLTQQENRLVVQIDLVNGKDGSEIWGKQFQRPAADLLMVQDEIARSIFEGLRLKLTPEEKGKLGKANPENHEAYQLYLKGLYYWNKRNGPALKKAITYFQQAIDLDPNYGLAYAGVAQCYTALQGYDIIAPVEGRVKAYAAAKKALAIDDTIAEAHTVIGGYLNQYEHNRVESEKEYRRAIELNPNYATGYQWFAENFIAQKRFPEALTLAKKAEDVDPLSLPVMTELGHVFYYEGNLQEAQREYEKALEMDANFVPAIRGLGLVYQRDGKFDQAISELMRAVKVDETPANWAYLACADAQAGKEKEAESILTRLLKTSEEMYVSPLRIAMIYATLKDSTKAIEWLQKAASDRSNYFIYLDVDPVWNPLRSNPQFQKLLSTIH